MKSGTAHTFDAIRSDLGTTKKNKKNKNKKAHPFYAIRSDLGTTKIQYYYNTGLLLSPSLPLSLSPSLCLSLVPLYIIQYYSSKIQYSYSGVQVGRLERESSQKSAHSRSLLSQ